MPYDLLLICFFFTILSKSISKIVQSYFVITVAKKFDIPTLDLKVYDDSKTEIDEEVFVSHKESRPWSTGDLFVCKPKSWWWVEPYIN